MLTTGTDSYITAAEADDYISNHYVSADVSAVRWAALTEADKEILLKSALSLIDALPLFGSSAEGQVLAFPRKSQEHVPPAVKQAQAELALWLSDTATRNEDKERDNLAAHGVSSISMGSLSMSLSNVKLHGALVCPAAANLLRCFVNGGFDTE